MFNKLIKKTKGDEKELVFPVQASAKVNPEEVVLVEENYQVNHSKTMINQVVTSLLDNPKFAQELIENVSQVVLETLSSKYGFEPTDKYKEEIENKKQYINQLNQYLVERKEINQSVENELQRFLSETAANLNKSLEMFSFKIQNEIQEAQSRNGIDVIRKTLTNTINTTDE